MAETDAENPLAQNIEAITSIHVQAEQQISRHQRAVEALTAFLGRPLFLYLIWLTVGVWIIANLLARHSGHQPWDPPPFYWLQGLIGFGGLLLTTVVLITQNRQGKRAEKRAHLDLQINLLAEQKITKLIALVEELRRDLPIVHDRSDPQAEAMQEAADPNAVLEALEKNLDQQETSGASASPAVQ